MIEKPEGSGRLRLVRPNPQQSLNPLAGYAGKTNTALLCKWAVSMILCLSTAESVGQMMTAG
jgi:hypothetical protein